MRVIVADNQVEVRSAIKLILEEKAGMAVIGEAGDNETLIRLVNTTCPQVLILDWELAESRPGEAMAAVLTINPGLAVIVLSSCPQVRAIALKAGAQAFVCKSDPPESLIRAVERLKAP